ncbi:sodium/proline symporter [Candidatus Babeliales bacterium]|nr:sodium/proline symporter [Candidatus Babeliales bacterium]
MFDAMIASFSLYFAILLSIGVYFYRKTTNQSEFSLGNRSLNYWLTAIAAQASDMSDWLFMGFPGAIYLLGISGIWFAFGLALFMFLTWQYIAPQLRKQTESYQALTLASFFETKFQDQSGLIKIISGFFCLYFFTFYIAAGIVGLGKAFELIFKLPYHYGIIIGLTISLFYTLLGGLLAVAWSNLLQGTFLLVCIMLVPIFAINTKLGGFAQFHQSLQLLGSDYFSLWPQGGILVTCMAILKWGPGYFGQPHILINFMSINNPENLSKAKWIGCSWQILALSAAVLVGVVGKVMLFPELGDAELVFIVMVKQMFTPFFAGLILCSILAATISTINIQSLISASLIAQDLYFPLFNSQRSARLQLLFTRLAIFIIPMLSLFIAWNRTGVWNLVLYAWSGLGVTFGPIVILSLYSKQLNRYGVIAGLIAGGLTAILWPLDGIIPVMVAGYIFNTTIALIVSKITNK